MADEATQGSENLSGVLAGAAAIVRGTQRLLASLGQASVTEYVLPDGRRADILALDRAGAFTIIEVKSCLVDFLSDGKWPDYRAYCDRFYFAVDAAFPAERVPEACGLMLADGYGAAIIREAPVHGLAGARRRALLVGFGLVAAGRLHRMADPAGSAGL